METRARIKRFGFLWMINPLHAGGKVVPPISNGFGSDKCYVPRTRRNRISLPASGQQITLGFKSASRAAFPIRADLDQLPLLDEEPDHRHNRRWLRVHTSTDLGDTQTVFPGIQQFDQLAKHCLSRTPAAARLDTQGRQKSMLLRFDRRPT